MVLILDKETKLHVLSEYNHFGHGHVGIALCNEQVTPDDTYGMIQIPESRVGKPRYSRKWCGKCLSLFRA